MYFLTRCRIWKDRGYIREDITGRPRRCPTHIPQPAAVHKVLQQSSQVRRLFIKMYRRWREIHSRSTWTKLEIVLCFFCALRNKMTSTNNAVTIVAKKWSQMQHCSSLNSGGSTPPLRYVLCEMYNTIWRQWGFYVQLMSIKSCVCFSNRSHLQFKLITAGCHNQSCILFCEGFSFFRVKCCYFSPDIGHSEAINAFNGDPKHKTHDPSKLLAKWLN